MSLSFTTVRALQYRTVHATFVDALRTIRLHMYYMYIMDMYSAPRVGCTDPTVAHTLSAPQMTMHLLE